MGKRLRNQLLLSLALGLIVFLGLTLYADASQIGGTLASFRWGYLPLILALASFNYLLRFVKWHYYLHQIGVRQVEVKESFLIFMSGLSMVITPWGIGQWLKSYFLAAMGAAPFSRSAPIVVAERFTDGLSAMVLAAAGLFLFGQVWWLFGVALLVSALAIGVVRFRPLARRLLSLAQTLPLLRRQTQPLLDFYQSSYALLSPRNLLIATAIGVVSWFGECMALYLVFLGLGMPAGGLLLLKATFIFAASTLAGALSFLPGGLGVAEGGITSLSQALLGLTRTPAAAATILVRLCTLWFGVALGAGMLMLTAGRLKRIEPEVGQEA